MIPEAAVEAARQAFGPSCEIRVSHLGIEVKLPGNQYTRIMKPDEAMRLSKDARDR